MSTHARIGMRNEDGTITSVYCHSDGYPSGVGKMLADYWMDPKAIREIMKRGDMSYLEYDFNLIKFYDEGKASQAKVASDEEFKLMKHTDWTYIYEKDGTWKVKAKNAKEFIPLESYFEDVPRVNMPNAR